MTAFKLATLVGEFVSTEIDDVNNVQYSSENSDATEFVVVMENGTRFSVKIQMTN